MSGMSVAVQHFIGELAGMRYAQRPAETVYPGRAVMLPGASRTRVGCACLARRAMLRCIRMAVH